MNKFIQVLIILLITGVSNIRSQDVISLSSCYTKALENHPQASNKELYQSLWQLKQDNLTTFWYPKIEAGANVLYNSNVTDLGDTFGSLPVPGLADNAPAMPHDQYKFTLDLNQVIYDGGVTKNNRKLEDTSLELSKEEIEVELYKLREQVNNYYFGFILLKKQQDLLNTYLETLTEQILTVESGIKNGVLLQTDREVLRAEKIKTEQQLADIEIRITSTSSVLCSLTGMDIKSSTEAVVPEPVVRYNESLSRPELKVLDLRQEQLEAGKSLIKSERMPKAFAFATLGYGKPAGNDFFSDSFGTYYIVGAGIKWNITGWNNSRRKSQIIDMNKSIINTNKETIEENLTRALEMKYAEIRSLEESIKSDKELTATLKNITKTAYSQYNNGTITASQYLIEMNKEKQAEINYEIHIINLARARIEYLNIAGIEIE